MDIPFIRGGLMKTQTNTKSIISLTLGILSIIISLIGLIPGIIGVILSKKGIVEIDNLNGKGRGFAVIGKVCSIIGICIHVIDYILPGMLFYMADLTTVLI